MMHRLQAQFARSEGEDAYVEALTAQVEAGELDAAEAVIVADLEALGTDLARTCLAIGPGKVVLSGWDELVEAIEVQEGDPVTGVAIGMGNDADLAFEKGVAHAPFASLGIYCDGAFAWSRAPRGSILEQAGKAEPAWLGSEEDIEVYLEIEGLTALNTALLHHKHRFFLRDGDPEKAPLGYVEYVLATWLRAVRFHQAVAAQVAAQGLPGNIPVVSGLIEMRPEVATVHGGHAGEIAVSAVAAAPQPEDASEMDDDDIAEADDLPEPSRGGAEVAPLVVAWKATPVEDVKEVSGTDIRRKIAAPPAEAPPPRRGFFARLFGR